MFSLQFEKKKIKKLIYSRWGVFFFNDSNDVNFDILFSKRKVYYFSKYSFYLS